MKTLLAFILIAVSYANAFSQNGGVEVYAGGSSSVLRGDVDQDDFDDSFSRRSSVQGGFLFIRPMTESFFCIKTGLGYSGRGVGAAGEVLKLKYAAITVLFRV